MEPSNPQPPLTRPAVGTSYKRDGVAQEIEHLSQLGHRTIALDLPGSGLSTSYPNAYLANDWDALRTEPSPKNDLGRQDYADVATPVVENLTASGSALTLVGHSFGGLTITLVGERVPNTIGPNAIQSLVYLAAYCPTLQMSRSAATYNALPENKASKFGHIQSGDPKISRGIRINPRSSDPNYLEKGRQAFFNDVPLEDYIKFAVNLNPNLSSKAAPDDARSTRD